MYDQYDLSAAIKASLESKEREDKMRAKKTDKKEPTNKSCKEIKERVRRLKCNEARSSGNDLLDGFKQNVEKRKSKIKELSISKETDNKTIEPKSNSKIGRPRKKKSDFEDKPANDEKSVVDTEQKELATLKQIDKFDKRPSLKRKIPKKPKENLEIAKENSKAPDKSVSFDEAPKTIPSPQNTKHVAHKVHLTKINKPKDKGDVDKISSESQSTKNKPEATPQQANKTPPKDEKEKVEEKIEKVEEAQSLETAIAPSSSCQEPKSILQSLKNSLTKNDIKSSQAPKQQKADEESHEVISVAAEDVEDEKDIQVMQNETQKPSLLSKIQAKQPSESDDERLQNKELEGSFETDVPDYIKSAKVQDSKGVLVPQSQVLKDDPNKLLIQCEIVWKPRPNGFQPSNTLYLNTDIKDLNPKLLIEFYETKLRYKTSVNSAKKF